LESCFVEKNGAIVLRKNTDYYYQCQAVMRVLGVAKLDFVLYLPFLEASILVIPVICDPDDTWNAFFGVVKLRAREYIFPKISEKSKGGPAGMRSLFVGRRALPQIGLQGTTSSASISATKRNSQQTTPATVKKLRRNSPLRTMSINTRASSANQATNFLSPVREETRQRRRTTRRFLKVIQPDVDGSSSNADADDQDTCSGSDFHDESEHIRNSREESSDGSKENDSVQYNRSVQALRASRLKSGAPITTRKSVAAGSSNMIRQVAPNTHSFRSSLRERASSPHSSIVLTPPPPERASSPHSSIVLTPPPPERASSPHSSIVLTPPPNSNNATPRSKTTLEHRRVSFDDILDLEPSIIVVSSDDKPSSQRSELHEDEGHLRESVIRIELANLLQPVHFDDDDDDVIANELPSPRLFRAQQAREWAERRNSLVELSDDDYEERSEDSVLGEEVQQEDHVEDEEESQEEEEDAETAAWDAYMSDFNLPVKFTPRLREGDYETVYEKGMA
jgi:hypothetical protein